jgi:hypothetical protein
MMYGFMTQLVAWDTPSEMMLIMARLTRKQVANKHADEEEFNFASEI